MAKRNLKEGLSSALGTVGKSTQVSGSRNRVNFPLGFQIDREQLQHLKAIAQAENRDVKDVIDEAIAFYLEFQVDIQPTKQP